MRKVYLLLAAGSQKRNAHSMGSAPTRSNNDCSSGTLKRRKVTTGLWNQLICAKILDVKASNQVVFYDIVRLRFPEAEYTEHHRKARRHCLVQQYSSGTGRHVVESKKERTARGKEVVYVRVGHISIVDLAHLAGFAMLPISACFDALQAVSSDLVLPQTLLCLMYC